MDTTLVTLDLTRISAEQMARLEELAEAATEARAELIWWRTWSDRALTVTLVAGAVALFAPLGMMSSILSARASGATVDPQAFNWVCALAAAGLVASFVVWNYTTRRVKEASDVSMATSWAITDFIAQNWGISASNQDAETSKDIPVEDDR